MNNQPPRNNGVEGEPLELEILLDFADIDEFDVEAAAEWFDTYASSMWIGALDNEPVNNG